MALYTGGKKYRTGEIIAVTHSSRTSGDYSNAHGPSGTHKSVGWGLQVPIVESPNNSIVIIKFNYYTMSQWTYTSIPRTACFGIVSMFRHTSVPSAGNSTELGTFLSRRQHGRRKCYGGDSTGTDAPAYNSVDFTVIDTSPVDDYYYYLTLANGNSPFTSTIYANNTYKFEMTAHEIYTG